MTRIKYSKYSVLRWLPKEHKYKKYRLPVGACIYSDNMDRVVSCASCGNKIKYGDSYTSRQIHTELGIGFAVCYECYKKEFKEAE